jgi:Tfp pilus assembly protein FimT
MPEARASGMQALVKASFEMSCCERPYDKPSEWGVTLVEVILVVAIVAIMSGMAISSLTPRDAELKSAAYELSTNLMQARLRAIKQNQDVEVGFDTANERYNATLDDSGDVIYQIQLNAGINLSTNNTTVSFTPLGTASNSNFQLVGSTGDSYSIDVSNIGNIKVN